MCFYPPPPRCRGEIAERIDVSSHSLPFRGTPSRGFVAATSLLVLFALSPGAFAQAPAPAVVQVWLIGKATQGLHTLGSEVQVGVFIDGPPVVITGRPRVAIIVGRRYAVR